MKLYACYASIDCLHRDVDDVVLRRVHVSLRTNKHVHVSLMRVFHLAWCHVGAEGQVVSVSQQTNVGL